MYKEIDTELRNRYERRDCMRHFQFLTDADREKVFYKKPEYITAASDKELIAHSLGATLYIPANHEKLSKKIADQMNVGVVSMVICLEDAIGDNQIEEAQRMLCDELEQIQKEVECGHLNGNNLPFLFVRVRNPEQLEKLYKELTGCLDLIYGFVFPKFSPTNAEKFMSVLEVINKDRNKPFMVMPILESPDLIHWETRRETLSELVGICEKYRAWILNIRIGATDFSSVFGLRRGHDYTVYDIHVIRDCITDIVNTFCRRGRDFVVSGPVWEYFWNDTRKLKPKLRATPFEEEYGDKGARKRKDILNKYLDGLIYEVLLDRMNGLVGKTVIHPSHIIPVQSLYVVSHEDYMDALSILENGNGEVGVLKSSYENKMNEIKPHRNWAYKTLLRARAYGVFQPGCDYVSLLK